jgi:hypothetical protein
MGRMWGRHAVLLAALAGGCAHPAGRVALTPLTVVRDTVDAPLVSLTNVFEYWADKSNPIPMPGAGVGVGTGGFGAGIGLNLTYWLVKPLSWIFGAVDYVVCRSLWPDFPTGISPWLAEGESWGSLYFPSTRALWRDEGDEAPLEEEGEADAPAPAGDAVPK